MNFVSENLIPVVPGKLVPAIKIDRLVFPMAAVSSGTNTQDATATAADILIGKTAYVKTGKVLGTLVPSTINISNAESFSGTYRTTHITYNALPVYELTQ